MPNSLESPGTICTRRTTLKLGMAFGTGLIASAGTLHAAYAQATPEVSETYARPDVLVDAAWLQDHQRDPSVVLVGFMPVEDFETGHIAGSVQIDWPELEVVDTSDTSIESWRQDVAQSLGNLGITTDSTVVVYDAGTLFAARLWWILHYLGHESVHVLNGGLAAWHDSGNPVEEGAAHMSAGTGEPYAGDPQPDVLAQMDEVRARLDDPGVAIVDARTTDEYASGHVPGAVNINFPQNALSDPPKFWKPAGELRSMYEELGVTPDKLVIPYCSSGVRSAVTIFTLFLLGYDDIALYTGSWQEWGDDPDVPKAEGNQP